MIQLRKDAMEIIREAIYQVLPQSAVKKALEEKNFLGDVVVIAIGKAAWTMADAAQKVLGDKIKHGVVVTKYEHSQGEISNFDIVEAGHPILDENSVIGAAKALEAVKGLSDKDTVLFLISGGGSALFEKPLKNVTLEDMKWITDQLLKSGADIVEINTVRKHLSAVKGGRFALSCYPANVFSIVLSDVLGDKLDSIASGPAYPDSSTSKDALDVLKRYQIQVPDRVKEALLQETPKELLHCETVVTGSVKQLCQAAAKKAEEQGYSSIILTSVLECEAKQAGKMLSAIAKSIVEDGLPLQAPCAVIMGGETVVRITGNGKGGRNQEIVLQAAQEISGYSNVVICSVGSDGTDGPTDAAGGMVDGQTKLRLMEKGISIPEILIQNNSYEALKESGDLIITGPTGTNVNDFQMILIGNGDRN